jgi:hypothetical protein
VSDERLVQTPVRTSFSALAVALFHDRALWIESVSSGPRVDREVANSQDKVFGSSTGLLAGFRLF